MTRVKICGLRTVEDVRKVNDLAPDYVGFVFAESSSRRVSRKTAAQMKRGLASGVKSVGVFVNQRISMISDLVNDGLIDCVQLHGDEGEDYICELKSRTGCPIIKSVSIGREAPTDFPAGADYLLLDTASPRRGGTGKAFDWALAADIKAPFFLAGGLSESNVTQALAALSPYCVDVSSGVETDGVKDEEKIRRLMQLVREEG